MYKQYLDITHTIFRPLAVGESVDLIVLDSEIVFVGGLGNR